MANKFIGHPERIAQLQAAFDAGHELANHTTTHPDITTIPLDTAVQDIDKCQQLLLDTFDKAQENARLFLDGQVTVYNTDAAFAS